MGGKTHKARISASISMPLAKRATAVASKLNISRSALIEHALEDFLNEAELHAKLLGDQKVMGAFSKAMSAPGVMSAMAKAMSEEITDDQQQRLRDLLAGLGDIK